MTTDRITILESALKEIDLMLTKLVGDPTIENICEIKGYIKKVLKGDTT